MEIPREELAIVTFGNVSGIDRAEGVVAIKPSGVPYHRLKVEDIVIVDLDNVLVEGSMRPANLSIRVDVVGPQGPITSSRAGATGPT